MKNKKKKNNTKRIIYSVLVVYVAYILIQQEMYLFACKKQENLFAKEIQKQKQVSRQIEEQKQLYRTDSYIEEIAREKLGMVLPGEKVFVDVSN